jgi:pilus assembly protein Flp/PilA
MLFVKKVKSVPCGTDINPKKEMQMEKLTKMYIMAATFMDSMKNSLKNRKGQTMVEYALLLALIAIVVMIAVAFVGGRAGNKFNAVGNALS